MNPILRNVLAVLAGIIAGFAVNMLIVNFSGVIIPPPPGVDNTSMEGLQASMHLFEFKHYIMPFLAHALGTLAGALVVCWLAASHHFKLAIGIGVLFLLGGIAAVIMLPSPLWFNIADLVLAYIPMAYLGWMLAGSK